jgi:hypothetical protein
VASSGADADLIRPEPEPALRLLPLGLLRVRRLFEEGDHGWLFASTFWVVTYLDASHAQRFAAVHIFSPTPPDRIHPPSTLTRSCENPGFLAGVRLSSDALK